MTLMAGIPPEISGSPSAPEKEQGATCERRVVYGAGTDTPFASMTLGALDATRPFSDWSPGTTGRDVVELFLSGIGVADDAGRDGEFGWVRLHIQESLPNAEATRVNLAIVRADSDSNWYFAASADTSEHLDALLAAFVATSLAGD